MGTTRKQRGAQGCSRRQEREATPSRDVVGLPHLSHDRFPFDVGTFARSIFSFTEPNWMCRRRRLPSAASCYGGAFAGRKVEPPGAAEFFQGVVVAVESVERAPPLEIKASPIRRIDGCLSVSLHRVFELSLCIQCVAPALQRVGPVRPFLMGNRELGDGGLALAAAQESFAPTFIGRGDGRGQRHCGRVIFLRFAPIPRRSVMSPLKRRQSTKRPPRAMSASAVAPAPDENSPRANQHAQGVEMLAATALSLAAIPSAICNPAVAREKLRASIASRARTKALCAMT